MSSVQPLTMYDLVDFLKLYSKLYYKDFYCSNFTLYRGIIEVDIELMPIPLIETTTVPMSKLDQFIEAIPTLNYINEITKCAITVDYDNITLCSIDVKERTVTLDYSMDDFEMSKIIEFCREKNIISITIKNT